MLLTRALPCTFRGKNKDTHNRPFKKIYGISYKVKMEKIKNWAATRSSFP